MLDQLPTLMATVSTQVAALDSKITAGFAAVDKRADEQDNELGSVSRALWYLLAGLLIAMVGAVIGALLVL